MSNTTSFHPAELAYILSYLKVNALIGWGADPFTPPRGHANAFYADGLARLTRAKRLLPGKQPGRHRFSDEAARIAGTLADPQIVLVTHRKTGAGARILTHHVAGTNVVELSLGQDGNFQVVAYPSLAGAAGAAAAFVGAGAESVATPDRIEATQDIFVRIKAQAKKGPAKTAITGLTKLGATEAVARSVVAAFSKPAASGVVNVMYCAGNAVQDVETYAMLTNAAGESWAVFPPASADGPVVLERTSISALTARVLVAISARMVSPI